MNLNSKITAIIGTSTAPLDFLVQAVFSLILRTPKESLDQIIISINGPDRRTGDVSLQDQKEQFAKELVDLGYPITVVRTWSRTDPSRPFQLSIPLVRTRYYLLMQDDVIIVNDKWWQYALELFENNQCGIVMSAQQITRRLQAHCPNETLSQVDFWQMNMAFIAVDATRCSNDWTSYYGIRFGQQINNVKDFINYHIENDNFHWQYINMFRYANGDIKAYIDKNLEDHPIEYAFLPLEGKNYDYVNIPMGAWVYYHFRESIELFKPKTIYHFCEASTKENNLVDALAPSIQLKNIIESLSDDLIKIFNKYLPRRKGIVVPEVVVWHRRRRNGGYPLTLISVCVYKRIHIVEKWMRRWYTKFNTYNSKVALVHNFDGESPNPDERDRLLALKPDYYVPRFNRGQDIGIFQDIVEKRLPYFQPDYDLLFCFTDDTHPVHKDFLGVFMDVMKISDVGLCPPYCFERTVRSNAFGIRKDVAERLHFPADPVITKLQCFQIETEMSQQVTEMGLKVYKLPESKNSIQTLVWDQDTTGEPLPDEMIGTNY